MTLISSRPFNREEHVFHSPHLANLLKDAIRFFNGTPVYRLPPPARFEGAGVYALYYTGVLPLYSEIARTNRLAYNLPIYVGKAIPQGGRRGLETAKTTKALVNRLREHGRNITEGGGLELEEFACRFIIIPHGEETLISPIESALIRQYAPIWNSQIDGFGNHDPGKGRYEQAKSPWDVIHPGRGWADKCQGVAISREDALKIVAKYNSLLKQKNDEQGL